MTDVRVKIGPLDGLVEGAGRCVEAEGHRIAVFLVDGVVYAIGDRCSHAEASLSEGEVFDTAVECPRHGSEFELKTGKPGSFPATVPVPVYTTEVDDGDVYVLVHPIEENA